MRYISILAFALLATACANSTDTPQVSNERAEFAPSYEAKGCATPSRGAVGRGTRIACD